MRNISRPSYLLPALFLILLASNVAAQQIDKIHGDHFRYDATSYNYDKLRPVLSSDSAALAMYEKAMKAKKTSVVLLITTGGIVVTSAMVPIVDNWINPNRWCDFICVPEFIAFVGIVLISPLVLSSAGIARISFTNRKRKSINLFNDGNSDFGLLEEYGEQPEWQLSVTPTGNGVGVVVQF